jgi:hypothetical protein
MINPKPAILVLLFAALSQVSFTQDYFEPKGSFSVDLGIPGKGHNSSFSRVLEGLFNGGFTLQYNVVGGLTAGVGLKYSFFTVNPFALNNVPWGGGLHIPAGYAKIGYERFTTERISFNASVRFGYSAIYSVHGNDSCAAGMEKNLLEPAFFVEPQFEIVLLTDKVSPDGFSVIISYPFYFNEFGPRYLCLEQFPGLIQADYEGITRFFSFGFGYRRYMGRK